MSRLVTLLVLPWIVTVALADVPSLPRLVSDAQRLNETRADRIQAEIALQQTIVNGRQALLDEGYAAPLEVEAASMRLREMEALRSAVRKYRTFLSQLIAAGPSQRQPIGKQQVMIRWPDTPAPTVLLFDVAQVADNQEELNALSRQIANERANAQGQLKAVAAEVTYLQKLIKRLRGIDDGSVALGREIELASLRLAVAKSRLAMGQAQQQYECCHELLNQDNNRTGFPIQCGDQSLDSLTQLWQLLELQWQIHRTEAKREAVAARNDLQSMHYDRLVAVANAGAGRPGELGLLRALGTNSLRQLCGFDRQLAQLRRFRSDVLRIDDGRPAEGPWPPRGGDGLPGSSQESAAPISRRDAGQIRAAITATQWRMAQLDRMMPRDEATSNELTQAECELDVLRAKLQIARETKTLSDLAMQLQRHEPRATTINASTTRGSAAVAAKNAINDERDEIIVALFATGAEKQGKLALAKSRTKLMKSKLARLRELRRSGYATWQEVAMTERDMEIFRADELTAQEEQRIAGLEYQRIKLVIDTTRGFEPHVAALAR